MLAFLRRKFPVYHMHLHPGIRDHNGTERALILSLSRGADKRQCSHTGTSGERLHCAPLSTRNSSIDTLSSSDNGRRELAIEWQNSSLSLERQKELG